VIHSHILYMVCTSVILWYFEHLDHYNMLTNVVSIRSWEITSYKIGVIPCDMIFLIRITLTPHLVSMWYSLMWDAIIIWNSSIIFYRWFKLLLILVVIQISFLFQYFLEMVTWFNIFHKDIEQPIHPIITFISSIK
jgi:hypothetical protein